MVTALKTDPILPLKLSNVSVQKRNKSILDEFTADFGRTGFTVIMGPNGAGKSTLMRLMHGIERPRFGKVSWAVKTKNAAMKQSFVFQTPVLMRRTVMENVSYPLLVRGAAKTDANKQSLTALKNVGLFDRSELEAHFLSGGERQKMALARALIIEPEVLFLDEPTANLDGRSTREIETILQGVSSAGTRIIMATHDIGQARRLATEIMFLNKGKLCEKTSSEEFFQKPKSAAAQAYLNGDILE